MIMPIEVPGGHRAPPGSPPFPGGIGVSHLRVYDWPATDGLRGGTPHCHTACTEAYAVVAGSGRVHTLGGDGFAETPLEPGAFVWFTPGTIHRLVNDSGDLEILVLMQNAGLPEAGDMVLTLPDELLADPARYSEAAGLPEGALTTDGDDGPARARRDLAVEGFLALRAAIGDESDPSQRFGSIDHHMRGQTTQIGCADGPLAHFHARAAALVKPRVETWRAVWAAGPKAAVAATAAQLDALAAGDASNLADSAVHALPPPPEPRRFGCCGTLGVHVPA